MREIWVDGHKLVATAGNEQLDSTPVIFLHGVNASINYWGIDLPSAIGEHMRWYSLSLPGHYPAVFPKDFKQEDLTAEHFTHLLACAIQELIGNTPALVVGISTGGFFALNLAIRHPELVKGVICVSGFSHGRWTGLLGMYQRMVRLGVLGQLLYKFLYSGVKVTPHYLSWVLNTFYRGKTLSLKTNPHFKEILQNSYNDFVPQNLDSMIPYFYKMPDIDITDELYKITAPTLVLVGDADPIVSPNQANRIARHIKGSELKVIHNGGHVLSWEKPDEFKQLVNEWVENTFQEKAV